MTLKRDEDASFLFDVALKEFTRLTESPEVFLTYVLSVRAF